MVPIGSYGDFGLRLMLGIGFGGSYVELALLTESWQFGSLDIS